jgi:hypothetical protein
LRFRFLTLAGQADAQTLGGIYEVPPIFLFEPAAAKSPASGASVDEGSNEGSNEQIFGVDEHDPWPERPLTETAQQLARLNQHFRQASFSEFEMLMGLDDEVLKRYGLPKLTVKRALIKAYETVVLDQQR